MTDPLPRLDFVFASDAPVCVILRRGPSQWVHLLKWNTLDDTIEPGAWFRGRIYDDGCDLSPDGRLFVYFATQYGQTRDEGYSNAWTAVSKPPWLTALAMWPRDDTWGGRAYFADNTNVVIDCPHWERLIAHKNHPPKGLNVITRWIGRDAPEQELPDRPRKAAHFETSGGLDRAEKPFWVVDGRLLRDGNGVTTVIADFGLMSHERTSSPPWAREW
jgi:hypothetical protein